MNVIGLGQNSRLLLPLENDQEVNQWLFSNANQVYLIDYDEDRDELSTCDLAIDGPANASTLASSPSLAETPINAAFPVKSLSSNPYYKNILSINNTIHALVEDPATAQVRATKFLHKIPHDIDGLVWSKSGSNLCTITKTNAIVYDFDNDKGMGFRVSNKA